jgi:hypothetical protein
MKRLLPGVPAFIGAANCVFVPLLFMGGLQQPLFPQPGFYFLEIAALGILGWGSVLWARGWFLPWFVAGVLLVFNVLGAMTIGLWLIPATICFLGAGFLHPNRVSVFQGLAWFVTGILVQGVLMQAWIYFS